MSSQGAEDKGKGLFGTIVDSFKIFEDTEPRATSPSSAESFRSGGSPQQYSQSASAKRSPTENYRSQRSSPQDYRDQYRQQQQPGSFFNRSSPGITNSRGYNIEEDLRETQKQLQIERNQREQLEHSMKMMQELLKRKDEESEGDFMEKLHHLRIQEARKTKAVLEMHRIWSNNPTGDGDGGAGSLFSKSSSKKKKKPTKKMYFTKRNVSSSGHPASARVQFHRSGADMYRSQAAMLKQAHLDSKNRGIAHVVKAGAIFEQSEQFMTIALFSASKLPNMDTFGQTDGYVKFVVGDQVIKSDYIRNTLDPTWNQLFCFEIFSSYRTSSSGFSLLVYDHNDLATDDFIGKVEVKWSAIDGSVFDVPILGGKTPDHIDGTRCGTVRFQVLPARVVSRNFTQGMKMNKDHFQHLQSMKPAKETVRAEPQSVSLFKASKNFMCIAIFSASGLPRMDVIGSCDPYIKIAFGDEVVKTEYKPNTQEPKWDQLFCLEVFPRYLSSSPGIVFEFWDHENFHTDDYFGKAEVQWGAINGHELELPIYGGKDPDHVDGTRKGVVRLQIVKAEAVAKDFQQGMHMGQEYFQELEMISRDEIQLTESKLQNQPPQQSQHELSRHESDEFEENDYEEKKSDTLKGPDLFEEAENHLMVAIHGASGLPVVDLIGSCDAYIKICVGDLTVKTGYKPDTLEPEWYQMFNFELPSLYSTKHPGISLEVYDHNNITQDRYIGKIEIKWSEMDGDIAEYTILGGNDPDHYDGSSKGTISVQVVKARPTMQDFQQGMAMEQEHFEALQNVKQAFSF